MRFQSILLLISLLTPLGAHGVDGALEINQACVAVGCFAGDTGAFPVQITATGSYRLTSNLTLPHQSVNAIEITAGNVSIDLNGFSIIGSNAFGGGSGGNCSASGTGSGVITTNADGLAVSNGQVRGMGLHGIVLLGNSRVKDVTAEQNCQAGITVGFGSSVIDSVARRNGGNGIVLDRASRVSDSVADFNGGNGIRNIAGDVLIVSCTANANGGRGILVGVRSQLRSNVANGNTSEGIEAGEDSLVESCTATANTIGGIVVGARSLVRGSVANGNFTYGIRSPNGDVLVESNTATANGIDGINVGVRSLLQGNAANSNLDDGIEVGDGSTLIQNLVSNNTGNGFHLATSVSAGFALGLNKAKNVPGPDINHGLWSGIACNSIPGFQSCPSHP